MIGTRITCDGRWYEARRLLGKGKSAHSWLAEGDGAPAVLKRMHQDAAEHYAFGDKLLAEVHAYGPLRDAGARLPALLAWSQPEQWLLKEYVPGPTAAELVAGGGLESGQWAAILLVQELLRRAGLHTDYFPTNFVWSGGEMVLIDYECHPYDREWDFPNWGMFYWLNREGMRAHLAGDPAPALNLPGRPKPVWAPFLAERDRLLREHGQAPVPPPEDVWTR